jgi:hypothetical protein
MTQGVNTMDDEGVKLLLLQAKYVLRDLHVKDDKCGYGKMADGVLAAYDRLEAYAEREHELEQALAGAIQELITMAHTQWSEIECTEEELVGDYRRILDKEQTK